MISAAEQSTWRSFCPGPEGEVEIPSDFSGLLWIRIDREGAWQLKLAREVKAAGLGIDLNKLA